MTKIKRIVVWTAALALGLLAVAGSWALVDTMLEVTGDYEFCTGCHSYEPIAAAYKEDVHGGNNTVGWRAACTQCHLPADNAVHYLVVKGIHGVVDPTMALLKDSEDIDWQGNRARREEFVYDSGCLSCHLYLKDKTEANRKAFRPHRRYFQNSDDLTCVGCHKHVGHARLGYHLERMGWPASRGDTP